MDPITTAIVTAVSAGAAAGATDVGKKAIADAYNGLKALIVKKFGNDLADAVKKVEDKPDSKGRVEVLSEEVENAKAHEDSEVLALVKTLVEALAKTPEGQKAIGKYNLNIQNSNVGAIGDNLTIKGGINF